MPVNLKAYQEIVEELAARNVTLVAVSKTRPVADIRSLYEAGHRDFGENYVQELEEKSALLPPDIRWHFIGHLQRNKVRTIIPFVHLIHGVDSPKLLTEIDRQAEKKDRRVNCLLQVHIAQEETKFGFSEEELDTVFKSPDTLSTLKNTVVSGLMGMASFTGDTTMIRREFHALGELFKKYRQHPAGPATLTTLSMGMSADYRLAVEEGSTMVRIGSLLFGTR
jgi:pyridoxal phosphate enzyme (YggS family)